MRRNFGPLLSVFAFCLFPTTATAQSLEEALQLTYDTNRALKAERARLRAEDQIRSSARAAGRPKIYLDGSATQNPSNFDTTSRRNSQSGGSHAGHVHKTLKPQPITSNIDTLDLLTQQDDSLITKYVGVSVVQPVFNGFRTRNGIREADAHVAAGQARLAAAEQNLFFKTIHSYLKVQAERAEQRALEKTISALQRRADLLSDSGSEADQAQASARLLRAKAQLFSLQSQLGESALSFQALVGQAPGDLSEQMQMPAMPVTLDDALALAQSNNPMILAAEREVDASAHGKKIAKGKHAPEVAVVANYGQTYDSLFQGNDVENRSLSVQLSLPLFDGGQSHAAIRRAGHINRALKLDLAEQQEDIELATRAAWQRFKAASQSKMLTEQAIVQSETALRGMTAQYDQGALTLVDVLNAEAEALSAEIALIQITMDQRLAAYELRALTGSLNAAALGLNVDLYDAKSLSDRDAKRWIGQR